VEPKIATEELQRALLDSVSHNLRAPLASIIGVLDSLIGDRELLDESTQRELLGSAREQAVRLNRLIGNLLDITRIEGGAIHLRVEPCNIRDVVAAAVLQLGRPSPGVVTIDVSSDLPPIPMDFALISQTLVNLIDNAMKYSWNGAVEIRARRLDSNIVISVADRGQGIPPEALERVFDKFYSAHAGTGIGLGLSICRGFVEAHRGTIRAENRDGGGAVITFTLPFIPGDR